MAEVWTPPAFDDVSTDEFVTAAQLNAFGNSLRFLKEVGYQEFTASVTVTGTSSGTANSVVSLGSITYDNVPHMLEFFAISARPDNSAASRSMTFTLYDDTTDLGNIGFVQTPAAANNHFPIRCMRRFTPSAAAHIYNVKAWVSAGSGSVQANTGGAGVNMPGFIRITRVPT